MSARSEFPPQPVGSVAAHEQRERMLDEIDRLRSVLIAAQNLAAAHNAHAEFEGDPRQSIRLEAEFYNAIGPVLDAVETYRQSSPSMPTHPLGADGDSGNQPSPRAAPP